MEKDKSKSLYETISSAVVDGELPNDFSSKEYGRKE